MIELQQLESMEVPGPKTKKPGNEGVVSVNLPKAEKEKLERLAKKYGISKNRFMVEVVKALKEESENV